METELSLEQWLNQEPLPEEIRTNVDGSRYIPIEFIKPKLSFLSSSWSTTNFQHSFPKMLNGKLFVSGSIELHISYYKDLRTTEGRKHIEKAILQKTERVISGAATFDIDDYYPNTHFAQTCLSLCIVAAAKEIGKFFGRDLNKERLTVPSEETGKKKKEPDLLVKKQMANAVVLNDQDTIESLKKSYDFVQPL